jgi:hypothetical protein
MLSATLDWGRAPPGDRTGRRVHVCAGAMPSARDIQWAVLGSNQCLSISRDSRRCQSFCAPVARQSVPLSGFYGLEMENERGQHERGGIRLSYWDPRVQASRGGRTQTCNARFGDSSASAARRRGEGPRWLNGQERKGWERIRPTSQRRFTQTLSFAPVGSLRTAAKTKFRRAQRLDHVPDCQVCTGVCTRRALTAGAAGVTHATTRNRHGCAVRVGPARIRTWDQRIMSRFGRSRRLSVCLEFPGKTTHGRVPRLGGSRRVLLPPLFPPAPEKPKRTRLRLRQSLGITRPPSACRTAGGLVHGTQLPVRGPD